MSSWTAEQLAAHLRGFEEASLTRDAWAPHGSHLAVTLVLCRRLDLDAALIAVRDGIHRVNRAIGVPESAYHETVTRFYVSLAHALVGRLDPGGPDEALVNTLAPRLDGPYPARLRAWAHYYTDPEALIASPEARERWVPPDRASFPALPDWLLEDGPS